MKNQKTKDDSIDIDEFSKRCSEIEERIAPHYRVDPFQKFVEITHKIGDGVGVAGRELKSAEVMGSAMRAEMTKMAIQEVARESMGFVDENHVELTRAVLDQLLDYSMVFYSEVYENAKRANAGLSLNPPVDFTQVKREQQEKLN